MYVTAKQATIDINFHALFLRLSCCIAVLFVLLNICILDNPYSKGVKLIIDKLHWCVQEIISLKNK